jgi:hypothetical protein
MSDYYEKYLKYKKKYLKQKNQKGGNLFLSPSALRSARTVPSRELPILPSHNENLDFFLNYNNRPYINNILRKYNYFNYSLDKSIIEGDIKNIGEASTNSFNSKIKLKNREDTNNFDVILKVCRQLSRDNNFYEYYVGNCINILKQYVPNFVHTFHHVFITPELKMKLSESYGILSTPKRAPIPYSNINEFKRESTFTSLTELNNSQKISEGCINNDRSAVLIDYIPNNLTFKNLLEDADFKLNKNYNLFCVLFQLYAALTILENNFTHHDLHLDNVLYIKLEKPIKIKYNAYDIYLITQFIPVILDYGRAFVDCVDFNTSILSSAFTELACASKYCNKIKDKYPECSLESSGLKIERDKSNNYSDLNDFYYINIRKRNHSHDLRYMWEIINSHSRVLDNVEYDLFKKLISILNRINNPEWIRNNLYGTKEEDHSFKVEDPFNPSNRIKTVVDMYNWLIKYYFENRFNTKPDPDNLYGIMEISVFIKLMIPWKFTKTSFVL